MCIKTEALGIHLEAKGKSAWKSLETTDLEKCDFHTGYENNYSPLPMKADYTGYSKKFRTLKLKFRLLSAFRPRP